MYDSYSIEHEYDAIICRLESILKYGTCDPIIINKLKDTSKTNINSNKTVSSFLSRIDYTPIKKIDTDDNEKQNEEHKNKIRYKYFHCSMCNKIRTKRYVFDTSDQINESVYGITIERYCYPCRKESEKKHKENKENIELQNKKKEDRKTKRRKYALEYLKRKKTEKSKSNDV